MRTLVLITLSFPYGGITEASFIEPEIAALSGSFERVIIAPSIMQSDPLQINLPPNVFVSDDLLLPAGILPRLRGLASEGASYVKAVMSGCNPVREISHNAYIGMTVEGLRKLIRNHSIDISDTLFYTFWFDFQTAALSEIPNAKFISRAHGYDIYEDGRGYISRYWRKRTLSKMQALYPVCDYSVNYLKTLYPDFGSKISTRRLGSLQPLGLNPLGDSKGIVCFGCARLSPEKGVIRQVELLMQYASANPHTNVIYHHIGGGELMPELLCLKEKAPDNLEIIVHGAVPNAEVHAFMASTHIDFTLLLSESEGLPISICESLSYGIPVIATGICGIPETVAEGGGITLPSETRLDDLAEAVSTILSNPQKFREEARLNWERNFSSQTLRQNFAKEISGL